MFHAATETVVWGQARPNHQLLIPSKQIRRKSWGKKIYRCPHSVSILYIKVVCRVGK